MIKGSIVAIVTPFNADSSINYPVLENLIEFQIKNGTACILVLGTTGEAPTINDIERRELIHFTVEKVNKRVPVMVGTGSNSTEHALELSLEAEKLGADCLLLASPYYNRANEKGMVLHFETVANRVNLPCILYNVPGRTGCNISVNAVKALSKHPNIIGIKEASGNISYATKIATLLSDNFYMWSGNDDIVLPMLSLGSIGVISVCANIIPKQMSEMIRYFYNGDLKTARKIQLEYLDLINTLFIETNPIPIKAMMTLAGYPVGNYRLPLCEPSRECDTAIRHIVAKYFN